LFHFHEFLDGGLIVVGERATNRHLAVEVFMGKHHGPVHKVAENGYQFVVVTGLEIFPGKIVVLGFRGVGGEHIAQYVLLAGKIHQIFVQPDGPVPGGGNLVAFEVEEFIGRHVVWQDVGSFSLEHGRKDDAMEDDVVLADEVHQAGILVFPPGLPAVGQQFSCIGDVTDGCIKPHVQHLAFSAFNRYGYAPVKVTTHGAWLKAHVQPTFALAVDVGFPLLVILEDPLFEEGFIDIKRQIPVLGLFENGGAAADHRFGIDQVGGVERGAAGFTLVAIGAFVVAMRAGPHDVTVGQELSGFVIVVLFGGLLQKQTLVVQGFEKVGG